MWTVSPSSATTSWPPCSFSSATHSPPIDRGGAVCLRPDQGVDVAWRCRVVEHGADLREREAEVLEHEDAVEALELFGGIAAGAAWRDVGGDEQADLIVVTEGRDRGLAQSPTDRRALVRHGGRMCADGTGR